MKNKRLTLFHSVIALLLCVSMLVGTTFAWFTDSVQTGINTIAAGTLDVELYHTNAAVQDEKVNSATELFKDLNGKDILWEPGVVSYENLRVANEGDLALGYQLSIATANENYVVESNGAMYGLSQILKVGVVEGGITATDRAGVVAAVADADWTTLASFLRDGALLPEGAGESEQTWGIVIYWEPGENDNYWNLNNGKQLNEGDVLNIDLGVKVIATQETEEFDSIDNKYDSNAKAEFFDGFQGGYVSAAVTVNDQGVTATAVSMDGGDVSAVIPAGVKVADGATALDLDVTKKVTSEANIQVGENEEMRPLDVHIENVAEGNTVPMLVTLKNYLSTGINTGALKLYHVENGVTVAMTQVENPVNHNEFSYDPLTGDLTLALASFSEIATVADSNNTWDGNPVTITEGSGTAEDPYMIASAGQLAYFRNEVDAGRMTDAYVKLNNNITLSGVNFDPIGWGYVNTSYNRDGAEGKVFMGTFDGGQYDESGELVGRNTIFDLYQNGWDLDPDKENYSNYTYTNCGFGLFASASGATFKNLTISGADIVTECVEMGVLVGLSQNTCTYDNIKILDSKIANYQRPAGGLIGEVSGDGTTTINKVVIGDDVVVGSLWGDFDAPVGGVIGARWDDQDKDPQIKMSYVDVGARLDVYNDITSAYQWHAYRRAGMLIGNTEQVDPENQHLAYADFLHCDTVNVYYGDWVNYTYCEFSNYNERYPWVRTQVGENCSAFSNPRWGVPNDANNIRVTDMNHVHKDGDECNVLRQFGQLYGGGQGVYGQDEHDGVTTPSYYTITYVNDSQVLDIIYVTDNTKEVDVANDQAYKLVHEWAEENMTDYQGFEIGGWMTAASKKLTKIPEGNTQNIVLYPYFSSPYTASFVDENENMLAWCFFNENNVDNLEPTFEKAKTNRIHPGEDFTLDHWIIRGTDTNGNAVNTTLAVDNTNWESFTGYKDVTITPHYKYLGADLIEVYDELTGELDHYEVKGYAGGEGSTLVEIPATVNGIEVTTINADAFSSYDDLHSVLIPGTITTINSQSFTANQGSSSIFPERDTVTLYYAGDPATWNAAMEAYNNRDDNYDADDTAMLKQSWDNNMGNGSRVFFVTYDVNGDPKVDQSAGYWELNSSLKWVFHNHAYTQAGIESCAHGIEAHIDSKYQYNSWDDKGYVFDADKYTDYAGTCDCDSCDGATRPDAEYWTTTETTTE